MVLSVTDITLSRRKLPRDSWTVIGVCAENNKLKFKVSDHKSVSKGNFITKGPVISRRRPEWGPLLCYAYYHHYILKTLCLFKKKKEKERDMCVVLFYL